MKLDLIVYNNTSIVGLVFLPEWYIAPVITLVIDNNELLNEKQKLLRYANYKKFDKDFTIKLKQKYKSGDIIGPDDYLEFAYIYSDLVNRGLDINKNDKNYYELACYSDNTFVWMIMEQLKKNLVGKNKEYYFKCAELLGDAFNGIGYRIQAYCYQEGIYVKKSQNQVYDFLKKAAKCGDEQSIELIQKEEKENGKRRKREPRKGTDKNCC